MLNFRKLLKTRESGAWLAILLCLLLVKPGFASPLEAPDIPLPQTKILDPALAYWTKLAKEGDGFSQRRLAKKYETGEGAPQNYEMAAYWYLQAARQNDKKAQEKLGSFYEDGLGVPQNDKIAAYWYRKATLNNYYLAGAKLARMYEYGKGVRRDIKKALELYQKSRHLEPGGPEWVGQGIARLQAKLQCANEAETTLFSNEILCASREDFHLAIIRAGGILEQTSANRLLDRYDSHKLLANSSELEVAYTPEGEFALARYKFPGYGDAHAVSQVKSMIQNRYGLPDIVRGSPRRGRKVSYVWKLKDGIRVSVTRGWPDTTIYMSFVNPAAYAKLSKQLP